MISKLTAPKGGKMKAGKCCVIVLRHFPMQVISGSAFYFNVPYLTPALPEDGAGEGARRATRNHIETAAALGASWRSRLHGSPGDFLAR